MAIRLRVKSLFSPGRIYAAFTNWFWLIILALWLLSLIWLANFALTSFRLEELDPKLVSARQERPDQKTSAALTALLDARASRSDNLPTDLNAGFAP